MNVKNLLSDEEAVSPVIGVILMVAITVILAAVIGTFVLGLGDQVQSSAPSANFQFNYPSSDYEAAGATDTDDTIEITHNGGQDVDVSNVEVQVATKRFTGLGSTSSGVSTAWPTTISTGSQLVLAETADDDANSFTGGDTVRVIWESSSGGSSNTIGESTVPS